MEFLVTISIAGEQVPTDRLGDLIEAETRRAAELVNAGAIERLWRPADRGPRWQNIGLWRADDEFQLRAVIATLPLHQWMTIDVAALEPHPSDPPRRGEGADS